jgi:RimJ/RimL family protein N-acetyltransferase
MPADLDRDHWHPASLEGGSVVLRRHQPGNLGQVVRWYRDPELARLTRYQTRPMTVEEIESFFRVRLLAADALAYAIHLRERDRFVGITTFSALDPDNGSALFHITIGERDAWGRGFGTEAAELMLRHAFERIGLHRVGLSVFSFNTRAIASYEKVGFREEGRLRDAIWRDGRYWDEVQMGVLEEEWRERVARSEDEALGQRSAAAAPASTG